MDKVVQSRKNIQALTLEGDKRATISFIIAQPVSGSGKRKGDTKNLPSTKMKLQIINNTIKPSMQSKKYLIQTITA